MTTKIVIKSTNKIILTRKGEITATNDSNNQQNNNL